MFTVADLNTVEYVRVEYNAFELPLLFRAALGIHQGNGASLSLQGGVLWLANPQDQAVIPGSEWAGVNKQGVIVLPLQFLDALNIQQHDYLKLTLHQSERRIAIVQKPRGCIVCSETDPARFTISDLICDVCMVNIEADITAGSGRRRR